jgi:hypothetical protein
MITLPPRGVTLHNHPGMGNAMIRTKDAWHA